MDHRIHGSSFLFLFPAELLSGIAGPEGAKNLAGKCPPPDSDPFDDAEFGKTSPPCQAKKPPPNRRFEFPKRGQLFIGVHNETLSVAAMRVSNSVRSFQWWIVKDVADDFAYLASVLPAQVSRCERRYKTGALSNRAS
ncbi:MAG: hypothetical protein AUH19_08755 [Verrucomicrobia bacterium 13_2_20CM_55_10]|nr:MAG: hypothetical protein AUH19_08755 [Verrucomicrobia bacterium 13_2_20CM_55_10]